MQTVIELRIVVVAQVQQGVGVNPTRARHATCKAESEQMMDQSSDGSGIHKPSSQGRLDVGLLEPAPHIPALLHLHLQLQLLIAHIPGCANPPAQSLDHRTAALGAPRELMERLRREACPRSLASEMVLSRQVVCQRMQGRERARSLRP